MKRILLFFLCFLLVIPCLAFSAFASEDYIPYDQTVFQTLPDGYYTIKFSFDGREYGISEPFYFSFNENEETTYVLYPSEDSIFTYIEFTHMELNIYSDGSVVLYAFLNEDFCALGDIVYIAPVSSSSDSSSSISPISESLPHVFTAVENVFQLITDNPLLSAFCAASLILVCIPLFSDLKKTSK